MIKLCLSHSPGNDIYSYTPLITSSALNVCLWSLTFKTAAPRNVTEHRQRKRVWKLVWLYKKCHKINLSGLFGHFPFYVILTISYLRAWTIDTSSLPNDSMRPLIEQFEIFSGLLTAYFNCKYFSITRGSLVGISPSGQNPCWGNNKSLGVNGSRSFRWTQTGERGMTGQKCLIRLLLVPACAEMNRAMLDLTGAS